MKRRIFAVPPERRDAVESALGDLLGEGWGRGCLTSYPQPTRPDQARPAATVYVCDAHLTDDEAAKVDALAADEASITLAKGKAVDERDAVELKPGDDAAGVPADKRRESLARVLASHAAKPQDDSKEVAPK